MQEVIRAKLKQAAALMREEDLDAWLIQLGRETYDHPQPVQQLLVGTTVTWPSAFLLSRDGRATAIVGTGDTANVESVGAYDAVIGYVQDLGPPLLDWLRQSDPRQLAVSWSRDDDSADNISHGMFVLLEEMLNDTPFAGRLVSADSVLVKLRSRKLPEEIDRIRAAIAATHDLFDVISRWLKPGVSEQEVYVAVHAAMRERGLQAAWDRQYDPIVSFGAGGVMGHAAAGSRPLEPGMLVHVDLGVKLDGYCSDLQRVWYLPGPGESQTPGEAEAAFAAVRGSLEAGREVLRPGVRGWEVDAAARQSLTNDGYDEPHFALGHQLGQTTHDGGCLLGPPWPRYGNRPQMVVEPNSVFTLEYAVATSAGVMGLEEDVLVTQGGAHYLGDPQTELWVLT